MKEKEITRELVFAICADVHHTDAYDATDRVKKFIKEAKERKAEFIIQLGDFIVPDESGKKMLKAWNEFDGGKYHVIGNHDVECGDKSTIMAFQGQEEKYYSFDCGDFHFIVLDTNYMKVNGKYVDYAGRNYRQDNFNCYLSADELSWLEEDLQKTDRRCFIFSHAPLVLGDWKIYNTHAFMDVVYKENQRCGYNKVTMCFSGHDHTDDYQCIGGIHYMIVNSMSHKYVGPKYWQARNAQAVAKEQNSKLSDIADYKDPLYAFVYLQRNGLIRIVGKQSEYIKYSPKELHYEYSSSPQISYREFWMNGFNEFDIS